MVITFYLNVTFSSHNSKLNNSSQNSPHELPLQIPKLLLQIPKLLLPNSQKSLLALEEKTSLYISHHSSALPKRKRFYLSAIPAPPIPLKRKRLYLYKKTDESKFSWTSPKLSALDQSGRSNLVTTRNGRT